jgi:esterase
MTELLHHTRLTGSDPHPDRWITVLHGVFGRGRNWSTVLRRVVERRSGWGALLVDLRLHGDSPAGSRPHTVAGAAGDVASLLEELDLPPTAVLGHSFGGKVALELAAAAPAGLRQLWVVDSTPEAKPPSGSAWGMIEVVRDLPSTFATRAEAVAGLERAGYAPAIAQWMAMNLEPREGAFGWRLDFDALEEILRDFFDRDLWSVVEAPPPGAEVHFVRASRGSVLSPEAVERLEKLEREGKGVVLHHLEGGHWLNADNPDGVVELLVERLP